LGNAVYTLVALISVAVLVALAAALLYALASVLQQREAERQPDTTSLRPSLLARLAKRPQWLVGLASDVGGYALQWLALMWGSLVVVQPLLVSGLLFALPIKARLASYRMRRRDWTAAALTTLGLAVFLIASNPAAGHPNVRPLTWGILLGAGAVLAAVLVAVGYESSPRWQGMAYGAAGGVVYGECAALTKTSAHLLSLGVVNLVESWQLYVLIGAGAAGMVLAMSAFQASPLDASLPALSATDPVVSVAIGAVAFGEAVRAGPLFTTAEGLSLALMVAGIFLLGHTDAVKVAQREHFALAGQHQTVN
jgi:drug/metabolite transporter (DMT)-like permease